MVYHDKLWQRLSIFVQFLDLRETVFYVFYFFPFLFLIYFQTNVPTLCFT